MSRLKQLMEAGSTCDIKAFRRAASQRLETARFLLDSRSRQHLDAVYLAGYAVECALKALILARTPQGSRSKVCEELTSGARSHDFAVLRRVLMTRGCSPPPEIRGALDSLKQEWRTDLRYVGAVIPLREARAFVDRVNFVYDWVERSL